MKLLAFQIRNFRSIVDSGWIPLSQDGITAFVGQNESGKSSVLDALFFALSDEAPTEDDFRVGADDPVVMFRISIEFSEIEAELSGNHVLEREAVKNFLILKNGIVEFETSWSRNTANRREKIGSYVGMFSQELSDLLDKTTTVSVSEILNTFVSTLSETNSDEVNPNQSSDVPKRNSFSPHDFASILLDAMPRAVLFNEESGRLPNHVDIDNEGQPTGIGHQAAKNYLLIAGIELPDLISGDRRARENTLNRANNKVSADFNSFWSQTIGKSGKLSLKCDIDNYGAGHEKSGMPHLVFWICDGSTQLYPKQRSQGVRWFVSFYLQLKASEISQQRRLFLLDEPGANLHSKAQADVLKLINKLAKERSTVIYSTHSPQLLEYSKLFRVHAVQRDGEQDDSPTKIIDAHRLGSASTDTLSPVLSAMGVDLSNHQVIRKTNNVLLEEMSGHYYLESFWKLTGQTKEAHFIAATGVNKIEALANMFRGWDLEFIVAIDDDKQGREVFKSLKRELFGDVDDLARKSLVKMPDCPGIEDAFSAADFRKFVLVDETATIIKSNAEFLKETSRSKPVLAFQFYLKVESGEISFENLDSHSQSKIQKIVEAISFRLTPL